MNDPWLTEEQLERLTKKKRPSAQAEELRRAGVPFRMVAGRPIVLIQSLSPAQKADAPRPQVKRLEGDRSRRSSITSRAKGARKPS